MKNKLSVVVMDLLVIDRRSLIAVARGGSRVEA
jgi:hypothetical protein